MKHRVFNQNDGFTLANWYTDPIYADYFRTLTTVPTINDFCNWPAFTNQVFFTLFDETWPGAAGFLFAYDFHSINRTCRAGIILDKYYHGKHIAKPILLEWYKHCINKFGVRKINAIVVNLNLVQGLKDMGFHEEGVHLKECLINGNFLDEYRLGLFAENLKETICQPAAL